MSARTVLIGVAALALCYGCGGGEVTGQSDLGVADVPADAGGEDAPADVPITPDVPDVPDAPDLPDAPDVTDAADVAIDTPPDVAPDVEPDIPPDPVPGDKCADPLVVPSDGLPFSHSADTALAIDDYTLAGGCDTGGQIGKGAPELVYQLTPLISGHYVIGLSPLTWIGRNPSVVYIVTDCDGVADSCVAVSPDLTPGGVFSALLEKDQTYFIIVDGLLAEDQGAFTFYIDNAVCVPQCPGPDCGKDGCGGLCGLGCSGGLACDVDGICKAPTEIEGNICELQFQVGDLPFTVHRDTYYGTNEHSFSPGECPGEPNPIGAGSNDHVYHFVPPLTGIYAITLISDYDSTLAISTACGAIDGNCVAGADASLDYEYIELTLEAGNDYWIVVDGADNDDNDNGIYTLHVDDVCIPECGDDVCGDDGCGGSCGECGDNLVCLDGACIPAPQGDSCTNPLLVSTELPYTYTGDTGDFTQDYSYGEGDCPGVEFGWGAASPDVAFYFTAPDADQYDFRVKADFDTTIYVVTDCNDIAASCLAGADNPVALSDEVISMWLAAGQSVYIIVDGYGNVSSPSGGFAFQVDEACVPMCEGKDCGPDGCGGECGECVGSQICNPGGECVEIPGNSCNEPFVVGELPFVGDGDTSDAAHVYGLPYDACPPETGVRGAASNDEVWAFTPTVSGVYHIDVEAGFAASVYIIEDCTYYEKECFIPYEPGPLVWYQIAWGCKPPDYTCHGHETAFAPGYSHLVMPTWLDADTTYFIIIDGNANNVDVSGLYQLSVDGPCFPECEGLECGPDGCDLTCGECELGDICNDDQLCEALPGNTCATAWEVDGAALPFTASGSTSDATNVYGVPEDGCGGEHDDYGSGSKDEVYVFTPPEDHAYEITIEAQWDAVVYVLEVCDDYLSSCFFKEQLGHWVWVDYTCGFASPCLGVGLTDDPKPLKLDMEAAKTYYIVVDGIGALYHTGGSYDITVDYACQPQCEGKDCGPDGCGDDCGKCPEGFGCNDEGLCIDMGSSMGNSCSNPWEVTTIPFLAAGDTSDDAHLYAPDDCGWAEDTGSKDEVWAFTPDESGIYVVNVTPEDVFVPVFYVVEDCVDLQFTCMTSTTTETVDVDLVAGKTYHIIVDGGGDAGPQEGTYVLEVSKP